MQAKDVADALIADLPAVKEDQRLTYMKGKLATIDDPDERALATSMFLATMTAVGHSESPTHLVVLIHGIRTQGVWQNKVASWLKKHDRVKPIIVGFDYIDLFSFWFPLFFRNAAIERVEREIRGALKDNPGATISIIAHSFGTYVLSQILLRRPDLRLNRVLLCGAIISTKYPWDNLASFPSGGVVNDVGTKDILPAMSRTASWGYGSSGTFGFRTHKVDDRYFDFGHSDFFTDAHIETYWVPYIVHGKIVESQWSIDRPTPPWWLSVLHIVPMKSIVFPAILGGVAAAVWGIVKLSFWIVNTIC